MSVSREDLGSVRRHDGHPAGPPPSRRTLLILALIVLVIAVALSAWIVVSLHAGADLSAAKPLTPAKYAVVIVVDGLGASDLKLARMPNLRRLEQSGVTYDNAWVAQMEAEPPVSAATIGTGLLPRHHGLIGLQWRDPATGHVVHEATPLHAQLGVLDQFLQSHASASLAGAVKDHNPAAIVLSVGGEGCVAPDAVATWLADYVLCPNRRNGHWVAGGLPGHALPAADAPTIAPVQVPRRGGAAVTVEGWRLGAEDDWIARYASAAIRRLRPRLTFVTLPEIGTIVPATPPTQRPRVLRRLLRGVDRDIGMVVGAMKAIHDYDQTAFVVTSARGLDSERIGLSARALDDAVLAGGGDATYTASDTASFVGLRVSLQSQPVAQAIQQAQLRNVDAVYYRSGSTNSPVYKPQYLNPDVPASFSSALDYLLSTMTASYAPDVVVIYRPGTLVTVSNGSSPPRQAGSLGPQWPDQHIPLIVAGHGILPGRRSRFPARLVDIAPTVASLLGLHLAHTDGIILVDAMIKPAGKDVAAQHSLARQLTPLVRALEQRGRSG